MTKSNDHYIAIVGLGVTGLSCARHLASMGRRFVVMDSRREPSGLAELQTLQGLQEVILGGLDRPKLLAASEIWLSPGVPLAHPDIAAVKAHVPVRGDVDVFRELANAPVIAITGSNGKSTVTTMVGAMAKACGKRVAVGGNLGTPVLDLLADNVDLYVLELSSFQLETTENLAAKAATILNLSQDHMDRYPSMEAYRRAKLRVFQGCEYLVLNRQDALTQPDDSSEPASAEMTQKMTWFGLDSPKSGDFGVSESETGILHLAKGQQRLLPVGQMMVKGRHNWANALAALALADVIGLERNQCLAALRQFSGLPHRCEWVGQHQGVVFINDSKATNVGATLAALEGLGPGSEGKLILVAGGQGKQQDFEPLFNGVSKWVSSAVLIGQASAQLRAGLATQIPVYEAVSLLEAVTKARDIALPGDTVVFSPACASFDMFANYAERGERFKQTVQALEQAAMTL